MSDHRILFTGTWGAGKTSAIAALSEVPPVPADVLGADTGAGRHRGATTGGLEHGLLTLDDGSRVRLFDTPGQPRFDLPSRILVRHALGLVILLDNSRPDPLSDLQVYLDGWHDELRRVPCVVGIGRTETHAQPTLDDYALWLERLGQLHPLLPVDVRRREDVLLLVDTVLAQVEVQLEQPR
ncbi:MAG TPA: GTP-binding protein [Ramlibacter sp.]|nr:GTP-binding protein [Ramlibacter sp.]